MVEIESSIRYPMEREEWLKTIAIGGVLSLFGFLVVPIILVYGYLIETVDGALSGADTPPAFEDWETLLKRGLFGWIIGVIYMLIPLLVLGLTVGSAVIAFLTGAGDGFGGVVALLGGFMLFFVLALVFGYVAVVGIVNYARTDEFGAGFDVDTIRQVAFSAEYFVPWLVSVGVFVVTGVIVGMLNVVPFLGAIVGAFVWFYASIVAAKLWAEGFAAAYEGGVEEASSTDTAVVE